MGYGILGYKTKNDAMADELDLDKFYMECQYGYQLLFREILGDGDILKYNVVVTTKTINGFKKLVSELKSKTDSDITFLRGTLSNNLIEDVTREFEELIEMLENKEIGYLSIN